MSLIDPKILFEDYSEFKDMEEKKALSKKEAFKRAIKKVPGELIKDPKASRLISGNPLKMAIKLGIKAPTAFYKQLKQLEIEDQPTKIYKQAKKATKKIRT